MGASQALKHITKPKKNYNPLTKKVLSAQAALNNSDNALSNELFKLILKSHMIIDGNLLTTASDAVISYLEPGHTVGSDISTEFRVENPDIFHFISHMLCCPLWSDIYVIETGNVFDYWIIVPDDSYQTYIEIMKAYNEYIAINAVENIDIIIFNNGQLDTDSMPNAKYRIRRVF